MTRAFRTDAIIELDRSIRAANLPFSPGEQVEVIILERAQKAADVRSESWRGLKGTLLRYQEPTEPVGVQDWDALK